jgi:stearoyl-CoA desaturase (delta-9 desaturase)
MSITSPLKPPTVGTVEFDPTTGIYFEKTKESKYLTTDEISKLPLLQQINWLSATIIFSPMIVTAMGVMYVPLQLNTFLWTLMFYFFTGMSITGGYHRLWAHKAYEAHWLVHAWFALWGSGAFEGSARWWCRLHRSHHRYIDTVHDPYRTFDGFWHAHWGWMVFKQDASLQGRVDISDLNSNKALVFQHQNYIQLALLMGVIIPTVGAGLLFGDFLGGLVYASFARIFFVHTATFFINSLAHTIGKQKYSTLHSSYDSIITAFLSLGEGYHNYHHEFPTDYRNGVRWYQFDPTKWTVSVLSWIGMAWSLLRTTDNEIKKARYQVKQEQLEKERTKLNWGRDPSTLPTWTWREVAERSSKEGLTLVVVDGVVIDVTQFKHQHPGGRAIMTFWAGRDATKAFNGDVYKHGKAARNLLAFYHVAKVEGNPE